MVGARRQQQIAFVWIAALFGHVAFYTIENAIALVKMDGWRFTRLFLIPWYQGDLAWWQLWSDQLAPDPLTAMLFIANANWFDLRLDYEAGFALVFGLLSLTLLYRHAAAMSPDRPIALWAIPVTLLWFSLTSPSVYTWSLVTQTHIALATTFGATLFALSRGPAPTLTARALAPYLGLTVCLVIFSRIAQLFVVSLLVVVLARAWRERDRADWILPLILVAALASRALWFAALGVGSPYQLESVIAYILERPTMLLAFPAYVGIGLTSAWLDLDAAGSRLSWGEPELITLGYLTLIGYAGALWAFFRGRLSGRTPLPATLIVFAVLSALSAAVFRFDPFLQPLSVAAVPRYYLIYALAAIGAIWILWDGLTDPKLRARRLRIGGFAAGIVAILVSQALSASAAWQRSGDLTAQVAEAERAMRANAKGDFSMKPGFAWIGYQDPEPYREGLAHLKARSLNLFAPGYPTRIRTDGENATGRGARE